MCPKEKEQIAGNRKYHSNPLIFIENWLTFLQFKHFLNFDVARVGGASPISEGIELFFIQVLTTHASSLDRFVIKKNKAEIML